MLSVCVPGTSVIALQAALAVNFLGPCAAARAHGNSFYSACCSTYTTTSHFLSLKTQKCDPTCSRARSRPRSRGRRLRPSSWSRCGYPGLGDIHLLPPSVSWQATAPKQAVCVWYVQCALAPALGGRGCMTLRLMDGGACAPGGREHSSLGSTTSSSRSTVRAFVTLDGRALCSCDTSLLRSEIQRPSGPRGEGR